MANEWYCLIGNREYGPLDDKKLRRLAQAGQLSKTDLVRKGQDRTWVLAGRIRGLFAHDTAWPRNPPPIATIDVPSTTKAYASTRSNVPLLMSTTGAILGVVTIAFVLGRNSARESIAERATINRHPASMPAAGAPNDSRVEVPDAETSLKRTSVSALATQSDVKTTPSNAIPKQLKAQLSPFKDAGAVRQIISDAEKSVVRIEVRVHGSADDTYDFLGSGFLVGHRIVATNFHVIDGARDVRITFQNGRKEFGLGWYAIDSKHDLALIECDSMELKPLTLATSRAIQLDTVFAIGSPRELGFTISSGIVSAVRPGEVPSLGENTVAIQTTAAISPGSSGGPLLNELGEAVGVIVSSKVTGQNLNFAIAAEHLAELLRSAPKDSKSFMSLPPSREPPHKAVPAAPAPGWIAKQQQANADAENKRLEAIKNESELNRIIVRAGQLTQSISATEAEGTALTAKRDQVAADMQAAALQAESIYSAAKTTAWNEYQQGTGNTGSAALTARANEALGVAAALKPQYDSLCQQLDYKAQQRDALVNELNALRQKYGQLRGK